MTFNRLAIVFTLIAMKNTPTSLRIDEIPQLLADNVRMRDREAVLLKISRIIEGGLGKLQVITDFDRTLSKQHHNGVTTPCSYSVFERIPSLPKKVLEGGADLYRKFGWYVEDPYLTAEEKAPYMVEWSRLHEELIVGLPYREDEIKQAIIDAQISLRDGAEKVFRKLSDASVPVLVFSAGLGDVVSGVLKLNKLDLENIRVVSNFFRHEGGLIRGYNGSRIHVYNKNEHAVENMDYFKDLSHRPNVILMGDSLGDANMADGVKGEGAILKIGFLSVKIDHFLPQFLDNFDIVLLDDQTMDVFNALMDLIL